MPPGLGHNPAMMRDACPAAASPESGFRTEEDHFFWKALVELAAAQEASQGELAAFAGASQGYVSKILAGKQAPKPALRRRLAAFFGLSYEDMLAFGRQRLDAAPYLAEEGVSRRCQVREPAYGGSEAAGRGGETTLVQSLVAGNEWVASAGAPSAFDLDWLAQPGFPAARQLPDPTFFLDAYAAVVAQRGGEEGRDASRVLRTLRVLATLTGQAVPDQRVWEAADINKVTWKHYDDLLSRAHLSVPTPAFSSNRLARLTAYPKRFLADTAMALALSDLAVSDLRANHSVAGRYLESFVMQQLRPQVDLVRGALLHLRTSAGEREVDAVVETAAGLVGIEVKLGTHPGPADARTLEWLRDQQGERFLLGLVVHSGRDSYPLGERLWAVPIAALTQPVHR